MTPKYPNIELQLTGKDGNAFAILGRLSKALRRAGLSHDQVKVIINECTRQPNYQSLLAKVMEYVEVT